VPKLLNWFPGEGHGVKYGFLMWATILKEFPAVRHSTERVTQCGATAPNVVPRSAPQRQTLFPAVGHRAEYMVLRCGLQRRLWSLLWPLRRIWFPAVDGGEEAAPLLVVALWITQREVVLVPRPTVLVLRNQVLRCGSPSRKKFWFHGPLYSY
jgi:hypothetical protein